MQWKLGTPSVQDFEADIKANLPLAFHGIGKDWPALSKWDPAAGGLDYLKSLAGEAVVQAMMRDKEGSAFYGDIRAHQRVNLPFREFLEAIDIRENENEALRQAYLAQVPIYSSECKGDCPLSSLADDISVPPCLEEGSVCNINFWMSCSSSRSSIHYDPYHNILCVVAGRKQVTLWPPSSAPQLYPLPLFGEASNHSAVDFVQPDYKKFPRFQEAAEHSEMLVLKAGDGLFIPEGWFHQVDSDAKTIAVNFWWPSKVSMAFGTHMDGYYLRRILSSLMDAEKDSILRSHNGWARPSQHPEADKVGEDISVVSLEDLTPLEASQLERILSEISYIVENLDRHNKQDRILDVLSTANLSSLRRMLLVMVDKFPRSLEALVLHGLQPATAELLTRKFEDMDKAFSEASQSQFYTCLYSVFNDPQAAMAALLDGKEAFAALALNDVLEKFLGELPPKTM